MLAVGLTTSASAQVSYEFTFDDAPAGTQANSLSQPTGLNVSFHFAVFAPDQDEFGDDIPGSEHWQIDLTAPPVLIDNPADWGRGDAPSVPHALEAVFQPVMILFDTPFNLDPLGFSTILDNDTFGFDGTLPGFEDIAALFFDPNDGLIDQIQIDQSEPGFVVETGGYQNLSYVVLPSNAFYDNVFISGTPVPEAATLTLLALGAFAVVRKRRRRVADQQ